MDWAAEHVPGGDPGHDVEDARLRAGHPAADVLAGAKRARGRGACRRLHAIPGILAYRLAADASAVAGRWRDLLRASLWRVRLSDHAVEPAESAARLGRHLCLHRRGIRRLASRDGFRLDLCPAHPRHVPAASEEDRVGPDGRGAEVNRNQLSATEVPE